MVIAQRTPMINNMADGMRCVFVCLAVVSLGPKLCRAVVLSEPSADHLVVPGVTTFGMNLDGTVLLGRKVMESDNLQELIPFCTGALVSDRHILTAAHCFDRDKDGQHDFTINVFPPVAGFARPTGSSVVGLNVDAIHFPDAWPAQNQDIAVVELIGTAPRDIPRYHLNNSQDEVGQPMVLAGYGATGSGATGADRGTLLPPIMRAGINRVDAIRRDMLGVEFLAYDFDSGQPANNALALNGFDSDLGFGGDEAIAGGGDSGGPLFIDGRIVGVNSFNARLPGADIDSLANDSWGEGGFATRVSGFRTFVLAATGGQAVFVPEPSACVHLLAMVAMLGLSRRCHPAH